MVFVLDSQRQPLDPCHEARARKLLRAGRAAVFRRYPFTIILNDRKAAVPVTHAHRLKLDPGSKTTGLAIVQETTDRVVFAAELTHRGQAIRDSLLERRAVRRNRRQRKMRYRKPRFDNRKRPDGTLVPSLAHRVLTTLTWVQRLRRVCPLTALSTELVQFDTQLMQDAEISGVAYQQGERAPYHDVGNAYADAIGPSVPQHWRGESGRRGTRRKNTSEARRKTRIRTAPVYDPRPLTWV
jgi:hypothetical protein